MSFSAVGAPPVGSTAAPTGLPRYVGWLCLVPALALLVFSYVWPTVELIVAALDGGGRGWDYALSSSAFGQYGHALSYAVLPILLLATVAPAFAWAASRAGLVGRRVARLSLALPLAAFAPTGLALVWLSDHRADSLVMTTFDGRGVMLATLGAFLVGVGVIGYLAALRRCEPQTRTGPAVLVVAALLVLAATAYALQQYTFVAVVDNTVGNDLGTVGGSPLAMLATVGMVGADPRWAPMAILMLLALAVLGVAAAIIVLRSRLAMEFDPAVRSADDRPAARSSTLALVGTAAGVLALLVFIVVQLGPWLVGVAGGVSDPSFVDDYGGLLAVFNTTWLVPLGTALVQVIAAVLGAFAIAVARPLGRHSEWLLLAFAPWLFVGNGLMELPRLGAGPDGMQPLLAYAPVSWLGVPALFLFTALFRGQAARWTRSRRAGEPRAFLRSMWPVLPMAGFVWGALWLVQAQDLLVATLADSGDGVVANGQLILSRGRLPFAPGVEPALGYPLALLILFTVGLMIVQWMYLDRVGIRVGRSPASLDESLRASSASRRADPHGRRQR